MAEYEVAPMIPVSQDSCLCVILPRPLEWVWDLGIASDQENTAKMMGLSDCVNVIMLDEVVAPVLLGETLCLVLKKQVAILGRPVWQGAEGGPQLADSKELNAANNHVNLEVDPVPVVPQMRLLSQLTP